MKNFFFYLIIFSIVLLFTSFNIKEVNENPIVPKFIKYQNSWAQKTLESLTLKEKIAQMMMLATWPNKGEAHQKDIDSLINNYKIGGLIIFQSDSKEQFKNSINHFQKISKTPLLIGLDAEWGSAMRIKNQNKFPYLSTLGIANDTVLTKNIAKSIANELKELGVHINFAPVVDIQSNPKNPVIGFRSFGDNLNVVSNNTIAFVNGLEDNGIMSCIKHFPGHGDVDKDSHLELPIINKSIEQFSNNEWIPFEVGIMNGASCVMNAHLQVPLLDESGVPSSLSKKIIKNYLIDKFKFKGLIISDALNMKAITSKYGKVEAVVRAFKAGNDILLYPETVAEAIDSIYILVKNGEISEKEIDDRCLKILKAKQYALFSLNKENNNTISESKTEFIKRQVYEKSSILVKNDNTLPLINNNEKVVFVSFGDISSAFNDMLLNFGNPDHVNFSTIEKAIDFISKNEKKYDIVISTLFTSSQLKEKNYGLPISLDEWSSNLKSRFKNVLLFFGNSNAIRENNLKSFNSVLICNENNSIFHDIAIQQLFGAIEVTAKNFIQLEDIKLPIHEHYTAINRLKYTLPEELGIPSEALNQIDIIVENAIKSKAFPGCQVLFAVKGKVIYKKNFGTVSYIDTTKVKDYHLYDIASVSKIAGSMICLMHMDNQNKFSLNKKLIDYLPELVQNTPFEQITLKNMLAHQAGFTPWIAFYKQTLVNGKYKNGIYSEKYSSEYPLQVANNLFITKDYENKIYQQILESSLKPNPKYEYSDLPYYFVRKIINKQTSLNIDEYLEKYFCKSLGLNKLCYNPKNKFDLEYIIPTENDTIFRKQLIHGFVHDPGAAMLGGIGGHAGLFSNSNDLAILMQMLLNKGNYANISYLSPGVINQYTSVQFSGNRRGAGFDKPTLNKVGGTACSLVSESSYGHSGFTGTLVWADPKFEINYVFLSNRICPDAENRKIQTMNVRTEIQKVMYEAVEKYVN